SAVDDRGAIPPVASREKCLCIRNEITNSHAWLPRVTPGVGAIAPHRYGILETRNDGKHANDVAILKQRGAGLLIVWELQSLARLVLHKAIDQNFAGIGYGA